MTHSGHGDMWRDRHEYRSGTPAADQGSRATGDAFSEAPDAAAPAYLDVMTRTAETRLTLAGYRLADIAEAIAGR